MTFSIDHFSNFCFAFQFFNAAKRLFARVLKRKHVPGISKKLKLHYEFCFWKLAGKKVLDIPKSEISIKWFAKSSAFEKMVFWLYYYLAEFTTFTL